MLTLKTRNVRPAHKNKAKVEPHTKNVSISVLTLKPSQFMSPTQNQVNFDPKTEVKSVSIPTLRTKILQAPWHEKHFNFDPDYVLFDPPTKPSQLWSVHWNQVNSDPQYWITSISTTHTTTKSISMPTPKPCHFRAVLLFVLYIRVHVLVIQQHYVYYNYEYQLVLFLTLPYYIVKPRKYCVVSSSSDTLYRCRREQKDGRWCDKVPISASSQRREDLSPWRRCSCFIILCLASYFSYFLLHPGMFIFFVLLRLCSSHLLLSASTYFMVCVLSACVICIPAHPEIPVFIPILFFRSSYFSGGLFRCALVPGTLALDLPSLIR